MTPTLEVVTSPTTDYLDGWTVAVLVVGLLAAGVLAVHGLRGRAPGRTGAVCTAAVQLTVGAAVGSYAVRTAQGQASVGPAWELWAYLVTVLFLPAVAWLWARSEPTRWSSFVLAAAAFVAAVMGARSAQIWYGVGFS